MKILKLIIAHSAHSASRLLLWLALLSQHLCSVTSSAGPPLRGRCVPCWNGEHHPRALSFPWSKRYPKPSDSQNPFRSFSDFFSPRNEEARHSESEVFIFLSGIAAIWGVVFPFEVIGDDMLQREFGYSADNAGFIIAAAPMVSILSPALVPFLGSTLHQKLAAFRNLPWILIRTLRLSEWYQHFLKTSLTLLSHFAQLRCQPFYNPSKKSILFINLRSSETYTESLQCLCFFFRTGPCTSDGGLHCHWSISACNLWRPIGGLWLRSDLHRYWSAMISCRNVDTDTVRFFFWFVVPLLHPSFSFSFSADTSLFSKTHASTIASSFALFDWILT